MVKTEYQELTLIYKTINPRALWEKLLLIEIERVEIKAVDFS